MAVNLFPQPVPYAKRPMPPNADAESLSRFLSRELGFVERTLATMNVTPGRTITSSLVATSSDGVVLVDASAGAVTVTLPPALRYAGKRFVVKKVDASANAVTILPDGTDTIDGAASESLGAQWESLEVYAQADGWSVLSQANILPPSGISGAGTATFIPIWTGPTTLASSVISQVAGAVTVGGALEVQGTFTRSGTGGFVVAPATAGTINNVSIGVTTAAAGRFTTLESTGNATLGDASTDTHTVNGTLSVAAGSVTNALTVTTTGAIKQSLRHDASTRYDISVNATTNVVEHTLSVTGNVNTRHFFNRPIEINASGTTVYSAGINVSTLTQTTGTVADFVGGQFVASLGGPGGGTVTKLVGIRSNVTRTASTVVDAISQEVAALTATCTTAYGLLVNNITGGATNYAIYTNSGQVRFGDNVTASVVNNGNATLTVSNTSTDSAIIPNAVAYTATAAHTSGTRALAIGGVYSVNVQGIGGTTTDAIGLRAGVVRSNGTLTNAIGVDVQVTGTSTTAYGIRVNNITGGTTNYAIYTGNGQVRFGGNLALFADGSYGGGSLVAFIANATTVPSSNPTGGGILYAEGGALKWRGSSGTITTIAAA